MTALSCQVALVAGCRSEGVREPTMIHLVNDNPAAQLADSVELMYPCPGKQFHAQSSRAKTVSLSTCAIQHLDQGSDHSTNMTTAVFGSSSRVAEIYGTRHERG